MQQKQNRSWYNGEHPEILCNKCSKTLRYQVGNPDVYGTFGYVNLKYHGGYCSEYYAGDRSKPGLEDMTLYTFNLCEVCLKELFDSFSIPVREEQYDAYTGRTKKK